MVLPRLNFALTNNNEGSLLNENVASSLSPKKEEAYTGRAPASIPKISSLIPRKPKNYFRRLQTCIKHLKQMKLEPYLYMSVGRHMPKFPYDCPYAKTFLYAVKSGDNKKAMELMIANNWIVHVYDGMKLTALHWAAKRENDYLVDALIRFGCWIDG